jgi:hypothetical protein
MDKLTNKQISQHRSLPQNVLIVKVLKKNTFRTFIKPTR